MGDHRFRHRCPETSGINEFGNLVQKPSLLGHVRGLIKGARKHQLPVQRNRLALEANSIEAFRIIDQAEAALRRNQLNDLLQMAMRLGGRKDESRASQPKRLNLLRNRLE